MKNNMTHVGETLFKIRQELNTSQNHDNVLKGWKVSVSVE